MHFVTILDPCISIGEPRGEYPPFDLVRILLGLLFKIRWFQGDELDIWVMDSDGEPLVAKVEMSRHRFRIMHPKVWPADNCYFPDYTNPVTQAWWLLF